MLAKKLNALVVVAVAEAEPVSLAKLTVSMLSTAIPIKSTVVVAVVDLAVIVIESLDPVESVGVNVVDVALAARNSTEAMLVAFILEIVVADAAVS
jgi:hypothetical protein